LLGLVGSGLHRSELLRARLGDLGSLDATGELVPDLDADPLALRFVRGKSERITFLTDQARDAVHADIARRSAAGISVGPDMPLVASTSGSRATRETVAHSGRLNASLIEAGNLTNVELCRATGRFFRMWGLPGARFDARAAAATAEESR
jgi:integrase